MRSLSIALVAIAFFACATEDFDSDGSSLEESPRIDAGQDVVTPRTPASYVGVVLPGETVDVAPTARGVLAEVLVRPGDAVESGEPIATLDTRSAQEARDRTAADLRASKARLRSAKIDARQAVEVHEELAPLARSGALTRRELRDAETERARTKAAVEEAAAEIARLRTSLRQHERELQQTALAAPFAGTVAERFLDAGTVLEAGTPVVRLIGVSVPRVRFAVPPADIEHVVVGGSVRVHVDGQEEAATAEITRVAPQVDLASRRVFVEARIIGPLRSSAGMAVQIEL